MASRRHFITLASFSAAILCVGKLRGVLAGKNGSADAASDGPLIGLTALTAEFACAERLGSACLRGLTKGDIRPSDLAELVIADLGPNANYSSRRMLKKAVR